MRRSAKIRWPLLATAAALAIGACGTTRTAAPRAPPVVRLADGSAQAVLTEMAVAASAHGWRIADFGVDSILVDFGTEEVPMPVPDGTSPRTTEAHATALYVVRPAATGARITVFGDAAYWHPDLACWLPAPEGLVPSAALLPPEARTGTR
jgi:hypothetical protein